MSKSSGCLISFPHNILVLPDYDACRAPLFSPQTREADIDTIVSAARSVARARRLNWHATADLVQQTLVRVLMIQGTFDADRAQKRGALLWVWSVQVARREFSHDFRKKRPKCYSDLCREQLELSNARLDSMHQDSNRTAEWIEEAHIFAQDLPPALKSAFDDFVRELNGLPVVNNAPASTVRSRKSRMLTMLRRKLLDDVA